MLQISEFGLHTYSGAWLNDSGTPIDSVPIQPLQVFQHIHLPSYQLTITTEYVMTWGTLNEAVEPRVAKWSGAGAFKSGE